ncbi:protein of unknown function [endosymbiont DhMRE of Dentiscutata heterogama]|uniref:hypothetical protein n=1 Tax=endosymbiont DhMRE of Dentiscutata heterogama TaxID=1609546 RepID=UPI000629DB02|nr:hypothetical protein [endosymbiont DhMRE of Dentiscutata heterogama]CFW93418.1 protein of unknown function [endosymbiont DhMRE of Dentiscutata heterogama]
MPSKLGILLWLIPPWLIVICVIVLLAFFAFHRKFRVKIIKWLFKKFLSEKEKGESSINKSISNSKDVDDKSTNLGKVGKIGIFHRGDIILNLNGSQKEKRIKKKIVVN